MPALPASAENAVRQSLIPDEVVMATARRVWPSYGLPGSALACSTNWPPGARALVVTIDALTPNS